MSRSARLGGGLVIVLLLSLLALPALAASWPGDGGGDGWCWHRWWRCDHQFSTTTTTTAPKPTTTAPKPTTTAPKPTTTAPKPTTTVPPTTTTTVPPTTTTTVPPTTTTIEAGPDHSEVIALLAPPGPPRDPGGGPVGSEPKDDPRLGSIGDRIVSLGSDFVDVVLNGLGLSLLAILVPLLVAVWLTIEERVSVETGSLEL